MSRWVSVLFLFVLPLCSQPVDPAAKLQRAEHALAEEKFPDAIRLFAELLRADPANSGLAMNLGLACYGAGQYAKAAQQFTAVLDRQPEFRPAALLLGLSYARLKQWAKAIPHLDRVVAAEPGNVDACAELANSYLQTGEFEEAATHFFKVVERDAGRASAWQGLGLSYLALADTRLEALGHQAPDSAGWWELLAWRSIDRAQPAAAVVLFRQSLSKESARTGIHPAIAALYREAGKPEWAAREDSLEEKTPQPANARQAEFAEGHYWQLVDAVRREDSPDSLYWQARSYRALAGRAFAQFDMVPPTGETAELRAGIHCAQGRYGECAKDWQDALEISPKDVRIQQELARARKLAVMPGWRKLELVREMPAPLMK